MIEVIEHVDEPRLGALEQAIFSANPQLLIVTTPNREYNQLFEGLPEGKLRHTDHRFEWTREEFQNWATRNANSHGYQVSFEPIGDWHEQHGAPSQMAVFIKSELEQAA